MRKQTTKKSQPISRDLKENIQQAKEVFTSCEDFQTASWSYGAGPKYTAFSIHFETLTYNNKNNNFMRDTLKDLVMHEMFAGHDINSEDFIAFLEQQGIPSLEVILLDDFDHVIDQVLSGKIIVFINQWNKALCFEAGSIESRTVSEPISEAVVQGPHVGTVEDLKKNIGLLRIRLKDPGFKLVGMESGGRTKTDIVYGYLDTAVNPKVLAEFKRRINQVENAEILETAYIEELIEDSTYSPFPQYRYTERPDTAVAALLEGKIIVLVQGTGSILICPGLFTEFFQSSEDYYQRTLISSCIRLLRMFACGIALTLPGIYISLSSFHPELIPTNLLLAIIDSREGIPFPTIVEALIMQFFFELLREAGIRLPKTIGSAVSIVGALVIGESAINAGIASPIMVVIVALTGIASFSIPQYKIAIAFRILQFPLMLFAALLGIFGMMIGMLWIVLHLTSLRVLGQPYFEPLTPLRPKSLLDIFVRAPLKYLMRSPRKRNVG